MLISGNGHSGICTEIISLNPAPSNPPAPAGGGMQESRGRSRCLVPTSRDAEGGSTDLGLVDLAEMERNIADGSKPVEHVSPGW